MVKITLQGIIGHYTSSMGTVYAEYTSQLPNKYVIPSDYIKTEGQTYSRPRFNKNYRVIAVRWQQNARAVSIEMICEIIK